MCGVPVPFILLFLCCSLPSISYFLFYMHIKRVASPTLGRFYTWVKPWYSTYRRLCELEDQSRHEGVKKNLHPLQHLGSNLGRPAHSQVPCRLTYISSAHCSNLSITSPTSQLILQPFRHFTYITAHSQTLVASPTLQ